MTTDYRKSNHRRSGKSISKPTKEHEHECKTKISIQNPAYIFFGCSRDGNRDYRNRASHFWNFRTNQNGRRRSRRRRTTRRKERCSSLRPTQSWPSNLRGAQGKHQRAATKKTSRDTHSRKFATDPRRHPHQKEEEVEDEEEEKSGRDTSVHRIFLLFDVIHFVYPLVAVTRC